MTELLPGLKGVAETVVGPDNTADMAGSGTLPVFATPFMIALMEKAALGSVRPCLDEAESTVGTHIDVSHLSAALMGAAVRAESELTAVDGRKLTFTVRAYAGDTLLGEGSHQRFVINSERFMQKLLAKQE